MQRFLLILRTLIVRYKSNLFHFYLNFRFTRFLPRSFSRRVTTDLKKNAWLSRGYYTPCMRQPNAAEQLTYIKKWEMFMEYQSLSKI